jgi:mevalonate kinase
LNHLAESIKKAKSCFKRWGLAEGKIAQHMQMLQKHGALAVKPTGAGDGGYVLSLWEDIPPKELPVTLLKL